MKLCECGCGEMVKNRFVRGHSSRERRKSYLRMGARGRVLILMPAHFRAHFDGYVLLSIYLAEIALGKPLPPDAEVHHANGNKTKDFSNLVICENREYHRFVHLRLNAYNACGNKNYRKCPFCKQYDDLKNMYTPPRRANQQHHIKCKNKYQNKYHRSKKGLI